MFHRGAAEVHFVGGAGGTDSGQSSFFNDWQ